LLAANAVVGVRGQSGLGGLVRVRRGERGAGARTYQGRRGICEGGVAWAKARVARAKAARGRAALAQVMTDSA
jgi:hypothetical protein